jgi:hypothetical protein
VSRTTPAGAKRESVHLARSDLVDACNTWGVDRPSVDLYETTGTPHIPATDVELIADPARAARSLLEGHFQKLAGCALSERLRDEIEVQRDEVTRALENDGLHSTFARGGLIGVVLEWGAFTYRVMWNQNDASSHIYARKRTGDAWYLYRLRRARAEDLRHPAISAESRAMLRRQKTHERVCRLEREPFRRSTGAGPHLRRGVRSIELADGRFVALASPPKQVAILPGRAASSDAQRPLDEARVLEVMLRGSLAMSRTHSGNAGTMIDKELKGEALSSLVERNYREAAQWVITHRNDARLTLETALLIHRMLTRGIEEDYTNSRPKIRELAAFFLWLDSDQGRALAQSDPVALAERVHYHLVWLDALHGANGRTGRLLADLVLLQNGLAPAAYSDRDAYYDATRPESHAGRYPDADARIEYFRRLVDAGEAALAPDTRA